MVGSRPSKRGKTCNFQRKGQFHGTKNDLQLYCDDFFPLNYVRNVFSSKKKGISFHLSIARCQSTKMMEHRKYMSLADLKLTDSNLHSISDNIEEGSYIYIPRLCNSLQFFYSISKIKISKASKISLYQESVHITDIKNLMRLDLLNLVGKDYAYLLDHEVSFANHIT